MRHALDELARCRCIPLTEEEGAKLFLDVWAARDGYIDVILDRSEEVVERFLADHQAHALNAEERVRALQLMEMQRHAQLMYTSCGWFFDDISGIETVQVIAYAARVPCSWRAKCFARRLSPWSPHFWRTLAEAKSNVASAGDGARIYREKIGPMQLGLEQVAAHYAISSIFSSFAEETELFCYRVRRISYDDLHLGPRTACALGRVHIASAITGTLQSFQFAVLHFGDQNITAAVKPYVDADAAAVRSFRRAGC